MAEAERIPFMEAMTEPLLLKKAFDACSVPQQTILKSIYGEPLSAEELQHWYGFNGFGVYDELGYLIGTNGEFPYIVGREAQDITLIVGRRSGKSHKVASLVLVYETLCGDHKSRVGSDRQEAISLMVAQDLMTAKANVRQFLLDVIESSPIGKRELESKSLGKNESVTADQIRLKSGLIMVGPPTIKLRGQAISVCAMDEVAFWPTDRESANPDWEVEAAIKPAQMQFAPFQKIIKTSTPWIETGLLWQASQIGTYGCHLEDAEKRQAHEHTLVLHAPTAAMMNPHTTRVFLTKERAKDPITFDREYLANFSKSKSGFLNMAMLRSAVDSGVAHRLPKVGLQYIATLDPAFRRDAFTFCIGHLEGGAWYQDWIQSWRGTSEFPLRPGLVLREISTTCKVYGVRMVTSDQHHSDSLIELGQGVGLTITSNPYDNTLKGKMWGDFNSYLHQNKMHLLDHPEMLEELAKMERKLTQYGNVQYFGTRDDLAVVTALNIHTCLQWGERKPAKPVEQVSLAKQIYERTTKHVRSGLDKGDGAWWSQ